MNQFTQRQYIQEWIDARERTMVRVAELEVALRETLDSLECRAAGMINAFESEAIAHARTVLAKSAT